MYPNLDHKTVERNAMRDSLQDGLMELFLGGYFLLTGMLIQADMSALFVLLMIFLPTLLKRAKERFTYPRIGYVKFSDADRDIGRKALVALVFAVLLIGLVVFLRRHDDWTETLYRWVTLLPALLLLFVLVATGQRSGLMRFFVMAALALAAGLVIPFVRLPEKMDNIALYLLIMGGVLLPWGAVIFANFLRKNPLPAGDAQ